MLEEGLQDETSLVKWQRIFEESLLKAEELVQDSIKSRKSDLEDSVKKFDMVSQHFAEISDGVDRIKKDLKWCEEKVGSVSDASVGGSLEGSNQSSIDQLLKEKDDLLEALELIRKIESFQQDISNLRQLANQKNTVKCVSELLRLEIVAETPDIKDVIK